MRSFLYFSIMPTAFAQYCSNYVIQDTFIGPDFFNSWTWETFDDPTHGRVNYVDQATAMAANLSYATNTKFIMRADYGKVVQDYQRGRDSIRITSRNAYDNGIFVLDLAHMPQGCATWPAFWTLSQRGPWPNGGEIDIIEGVNQDTQNLASLHTTSQCSVPQYRSQTGYSVSTNCDASYNYNQGCGTRFSKFNSYGTGFNSVGGGWFVMLKCRNGVSVWFWSRNDPAIPRDVREGNYCMDPSEWGPPEAYFPIDSCEYNSHFNAHQMIFDLTFCGDWAGSAYSKSGCLGNCIDFVNNNPGSFIDAYWEINSLRVFIPSTSTQLS